MPMSDEMREGLERIERASQRANSRQPRFGATQKSQEAFFASVSNWLAVADLEEPKYQKDSRKRDKWLNEFWRRESHLSGVMSNVVSIDANRGWHLIGGRNQVNRFLNMFRYAEDGAGWRQYLVKQSTAFYATDMGSLTELGRDGRNGPLRALYHLDSTRCKLTGDRRRPLKYDKNKDPWRPEDFFRLNSMSNISEDYYGLGFCSISRCLDMARIMLAVYNHQLEKLGARAPRGLLLLQNISQEQWIEAMAARDASLDSEMRRYYNAVAVIAQEGLETIDAKLVALSQLPDNFDFEVFSNLLMYAYALCFNYDPTEFWPVAAGQLGRGRETDIQHRKGTGKGGLNFMLAYQDQMQMQLPDTLLFEFEQRDQEGVLLDAAITQAWANAAATLYGSGQSNGNRNPRKANGENREDAGNTDQSSDVGELTPSAEPQQQGMLSLKEVRHLLVDKGIIHPSWTEAEEEAQASDVKSLDTMRRRDSLMEKEQVRRAIYQYPQQPVVRYCWPDNRLEILAPSGEQVLRRVNYAVLHPDGLVPNYRRLAAPQPDSNLTPLVPPIVTPQSDVVKRIVGGFNLYRGDNPTFTIVVRDKNKQEISVQEAIEVAYSIYEKDPSQPLLQKQLGAGVTVEGCRVTVSFLPEDSINLLGHYNHRLRVTDDLGRPFTVFRGAMAVLSEAVDG